MDQDIKSAILKSLAATKVDLITPEDPGSNESNIQKVLAIKAHQLSNLSESKISEHIYSLAQYLVFLQMQVNVLHIKYIEAKRDYDLAVAKELSKTEGKTMKERTNLALINNEKLQALEKDLRIKETTYLLYDKIPESVVELCNAWKKELSLRANNGQRK